MYSTAVHVSDCACWLLQGYSGPAVLDLSHWLVRELDQQQQPAAMPSELLLLLLLLGVLACSYIYAANVVACL
jgi:hypothetical protein